MRFATSNSTVNLACERPPWSDDGLDALRVLVRDFLAAEAIPRLEAWDAQHHVDREFWNRAGEVGLLCAGIPEEYGGGGGNFKHETVIVEEQSRALVTGWGNQVHSGIVAHYILAYGTEEQKHRWLPGMASGDLVAAIAMTEPSTGSDLKRIRTRARMDGDSYVLNGSKTFISNGLLADLVVVVAVTDPDAGTRGISLIVAETQGLVGFGRSSPPRKIGMHAQDTTELFFDDVRVSKANLLGGMEGRGFGQLMQQLPAERLTIAVQSVGAVERALSETIAYTKEREAFGGRLFDFQNTRFKLAECHTTWRVARTFLDKCIEEHSEGRLDATTAAMAKWWCTELQGTVIDQCVQLHGGYGYMLEYPIARLYADARAQRIYGGANEIMKELVARSL
jgi:acyl-CoA dehydrogenase